MIKNKIITKEVKTDEVVLTSSSQFVRLEHKESFQITHLVGNDKFVTRLKIRKAASEFCVEVFFDDKLVLYVECDKIKFYQSPTLFYNIPSTICYNIVDTNK